MHSSQLVSVQEFARIANVSDATILKLCNDGKIVAGKVGGNWRIAAVPSLKKLGFVFDK